MFLEEKEGLKELVEKRLAVKEVIESYRKEVAEKEEVMKTLNKEIQDIQLSYQTTHEEFKTINDEINKMCLMEVWDTLPDTQMPKEIILKDGKPYCEVLDLVEDIKKQTAESKAVWKKALES